MIEVPSIAPVEPVNAEPVPGLLRRWFAPSPVELLVFALILWLIGYTVADSGGGLLHDSQTGYHIRIGEYVLAHHAVPRTDFLSFTKSGEPFFAWEWLTGVVSALLYHWNGLHALIVGSALLIGITVLLMIRHMVSRGANVFTAIFLIHLVIGASSIHYLARPHIFTLLFLTIALWVLDLDRAKPSAALWLLVPMTVLWANLHGGFFGLLVITAILCGGSLIEWSMRRDPEQLRYAIRYGVLTLGCFVASLANPYGILEHVHLIHYLRETWYLKLTEEYQPPHFLTMAGVYYGTLLIGGIIVAARLLQKKQIAPALVILAWAYASSRSMRHIPIYAIVVLPWLASELTYLWERWVAGKPRGSLAGVMRGAAADYQPSLKRLSLFLPAVSIILLFYSLGIEYPRDFSELLYPVSLVNHHYGQIGRARVFTTDSWGHYLTFRYPEPYRIYIDGRADFFGEQFTKEYLAVLNGDMGWQGTLKRYRIELALVPSDLPIAALLRKEPGWRVIEDTPTAVLSVTPTTSPEPVHADSNSQQISR